MNVARLVALSAVAALGACSVAPTQQTKEIPAGSGTLGTMASSSPRVEQTYTGKLAASGDNRSTTPHWTFEVEAKATASGDLGEGPHLRLSLTSDQSTIPVTADVTLASGSGTGTAKLEFDGTCTGECSHGFKVRFDRKDAGTGDIGLTWTGTISTNVEVALGTMPPGELSVTSP